MIGRLAVAVGVVWLGGCSGAKRASLENDRLRAEVMELQDRIRQLEQRGDELQAVIDGYASSLDAPARAVLDNTPLVTSITVGRLSHILDTDGDGIADQLVVYVTPADGLDRFVQMVGELTVHAALLPADGDAVTIGRVTLAPGDLRQAYRSNVLGTHYTVKVPITLPGGSAEQQCNARVAYVDGRDGRRLEADRSIDLTLHGTERARR